MFANAKLASMLSRVKLLGAVAVRNQLGRAGDQQPRAMCRAYSSTSTSTIPTARCGPACRVVWEGTAR